MIRFDSESEDVKLHTVVTNLVLMTGSEAWTAVMFLTHSPPDPATADVHVR